MVMKQPLRYRCCEGKDKCDGKLNFIWKHSLDDIQHASVKSVYFGELLLEVLDHYLIKQDLQLEINLQSQRVEKILVRPVMTIILKCVDH